MNTSPHNKIITRKLSKSNYDRPELTLTDTLQTNASMAEKLKNYERVEDIEDVNLNTHVRYVTWKDNKQRFCLGGLLTKIHKKYVILSNGTFSWSVQRYHWDQNNEDPDQEPIFETAFFKILSNRQLKDKQEKIIDEKNQEIERLSNIIRNIKK